MDNAQDKEIFSIINTNIKDISLKNELTKAILQGKGHIARIITEEIVENNKYNKVYKRLDNLVTNKFFG